MTIAIDEVKKAAQLAKIYIAEEKIESIRSEINSMFEFIDQIEEVDTNGIEPLISVVDYKIVMRKDGVNDGGIADEIVQNAPVTQEHFFLVPKVVE